MTLLLAGLIILITAMILSGRLVPRRTLPSARFNELERINLEVQGAHWDGVWTQAEVVLNRLPQWMRADFNCPVRGPHYWRSTHHMQYEFCAHCPARRRTSWPDTQRDPLDVIYDLQFSRR